MKEIPRLAAEEMAVIQMVSDTLPLCAHNSHGAIIDADKAFVPAMFGIVREKMTMSAADFPDQGPGD